MSENPTPDAAAGSEETPLSNFTNCHGGILKRLNSLEELPALLETARRARAVADKSLAFFRETIFEHHMEEERDLFPAVIASAQAGDELTRVKAMTERLTDEHRRVEALWKTLESSLKRAAKGRDADLNVSDLHRLVSEYRAHAAYEEAEFLPLAETILGRNSNHMAALGLSLHMRHAKLPVKPFF